MKNNETGNVLISTQSGNTTVLFTENVSYNGHEFFLSTKTATWNDSYDLCQRWGGWLASIRSKEEVKFIAQNLYVFVSV